MSISQSGEGILDGVVSCHLKKWVVKRRMGPAPPPPFWTLMLFFSGRGIIDGSSFLHQPVVTPLCLQIPNLWILIFKIYIYQGRSGKKHHPHPSSHIHPFSHSSAATYKQSSLWSCTSKAGQFPSLPLCPVSNDSDSIGCGGAQGETHEQKKPGFGQLAGPPIVLLGTGSLWKGSVPCGFLSSLPDVGRCGRVKGSTHQ